MTTILLCTVPMILGLVVIYRIFKVKLRDTEDRVERTMNNSIEHYYKINSKIHKDQLLFRLELDSKIMNLRNDAVTLSSRRYNREDEELQDYLEYRFRAESDDYAISKKIQKIKEEYAK